MIGRRGRVVSNFKKSETRPREAHATSCCEAGGGGEGSKSVLRIIKKGRKIFQKSISSREKKRLKLQKLSERVRGD